MDYTYQKPQVQSSQKDQQSPSSAPLTPNLNSSAAKRMSNVPLLRPESFIEEDSEEEDDGLYHIGNLPSSGTQSNAANTPKTQSPLIFTNNDSPNMDEQTSFQSFSSLNYNQQTNSNSSQPFNFQPRASSPPPKSSNGNGANGANANNSTTSTNNNSVNYPRYNRHSRYGSPYSVTGTLPTTPTSSSGNQNKANSNITNTTTNTITVTDTTGLQIPITSKHSRTNSMTQQYIPGPNLPPRASRSPTRSISHSRTSSPVRTTSPLKLNSPNRASSPSRNGDVLQPFNYNSTLMMLNNSSNNSLVPDYNNNGNSNTHNGTNNSISAGGRTSYRRGHRYKHSSVSMNLFQPDASGIIGNNENITSGNDILDLPEKPRISYPKPYPIPKFGAIISSLTKNQILKLAYGTFHLLLSLSLHILGFKYGNTFFSTLSHLVFYDGLGNLLVIIVTIMMNFDCWNSSSLKYPFGLGRIEVLMGFALSVSLLFVGIDLFSHIVEEVIIQLIVGDEGESHLHHTHESSTKNHLNPVVYESMIIIVILATIIGSSLVLQDTQTTSQATDTTKSHTGNSSSIRSRVRRKLTSELIGGNTAKIDDDIDLVDINNSSFFKKFSTTTFDSFLKKRHTINSSTSTLTLCYACYCTIYPLVTLTNQAEIINNISAILLSVFVTYNGWKLIRALSNILLVGYPYSANNFYQVEDKIKFEISQLDVFKPVYSIDEVLISKVNYKIFIIILKVKMFGASDEDESKLRFYSNKLVKKILNESIKNHGKLSTPAPKEFLNVPRSQKGGNQQLSVPKVRAKTGDINSNNDHASDGSNRFSSFSVNSSSTANDKPKPLVRSVSSSATAALTSLTRSFSSGGLSTQALKNAAASVGNAFGSSAGSNTDLLDSEDFESMDNSGERFEITIDIDRL
ncbi:hypothetical protein B5S33_g216 [[Candida] boidinii]|nr:hypothetical protein B5S30_g3598 [[Candida] boidinii]OWB81597.1 hypothetical protein B5S33_g216 [[Candida] boidinii]